MTLHTPASAAQYLGGNKPLSVRTLQRWRIIGEGPRFVKVGHFVRYHQSDLDEFLAAGRRTSTSYSGPIAA